MTSGLDYSTRLKSINFPLRLLVENEIFRLTVWANPINDAKRGTDHVGTTERTMLEVSGDFSVSYAVLTKLSSGLMDEHSWYPVEN